MYFFVPTGRNFGEGSRKEKHFPNRIGLARTHYARSVLSVQGYYSTMEEKLARAIALLTECGIETTVTLQFDGKSPPKTTVTQVGKPVEPEKPKDEPPQLVDKDDAWLSSKDAGKFLGDSCTKTLKRLADDGKIARKYVGKLPVYLKSSLHKL